MADIEHRLKDTTQSFRSISDELDISRYTLIKIAEMVYAGDPEGLRQRVYLNKAEVSQEDENKAINLIKTTEFSFVEIGGQLNLSSAYIGDLAKFNVYKDDPEMFKARVWLGYQHLDSETRGKLVDKLLHTSSSFDNIAVELGISGSTVGYHAKKLYENDPKAYQDRAMEGKQKIDREKRERIIKDIKETDLSFIKIGVKQEVGDETVRQTALNYVYKGNPDGYEARVRKGFGMVDLPTEQKVLADIQKNDGSSARKIARINNVSTWYVQELAFNRVHNGNLDAYCKQFPANHLDETAKARARDLIRTTSLNESQIAKKVRSEGEKISPCSVWHLACEVYPHRAEREERFPHSKAHRTGRYMHYVLEDSVKQHFDTQHKENPEEPQAYKEVTPHNPKPKRAGENVRADLIIPNKNQYLQHQLEHLNLENMPLAAELNLTPDQLRKVREVVVDFSLTTTQTNVRQKVRKYGAPDRLLLVVDTSTWWQEGRVKEMPDLPPNVKVIRPDLFADIIQLPETERVKWEQVIEAGERFDTHALKEMTHQCDTKHDQEAYDRDCPASDGGTLDKYFASPDPATQVSAAPAPENEHDILQDEPTEGQLVEGNEEEKGEENGEKNASEPPTGSTGEPSEETDEEVEETLPDTPEDLSNDAQGSDQSIESPDGETNQGQKEAGISSLEIPDYDKLAEQANQERIRMFDDPCDDLEVTDPFSEAKMPDYDKLAEQAKQERIRMLDDPCNDLEVTDPFSEAEMPDYLPGDDPFAREIPDSGKKATENDDDPIEPQKKDLPSDGARDRGKRRRERGE